MYTGSSSPGARWLLVGQVTDCFTKKNPKPKPTNNNEKPSIDVKVIDFYFYIPPPIWSSTLAISVSPFPSLLPLPQHVFSPTDSPRAAHPWVCLSSHGAFAARYCKVSGRSMPRKALEQGHAEAVRSWGTRTRERRLLRACKPSSAEFKVLAHFPPSYV